MYVNRSFVVYIVLIVHNRHAFRLPTECRQLSDRLLEISYISRSGAAEFTGRITIV